MAQYETEAIVLGVRNWGEADKMLRLFSRDHGKITAAAFGARRPKSPLASGLQMFHTVELTLSAGDRVDTVRGCRLVNRFPHLEADLVAMAYASFIAEVLLELMPDGAPQPEVYDWLPGVFAACGPKHPRLVALAAGFQLLDFAGLGLSFDACAVSGAPITGEAFFSATEGGALSPAAAVEIPDKRPYPETLRRLLSTLAVIDWASPPAFTAKRSDIMAGESLLVAYLQDTFGHGLRSLKFIRQLGA
ncbi:MAG: DNA repair protein RecO [Schwartzia sp.]|nr:DNA repair protein RecO [Schwartzia sp. (in: firmicutes)]MBR1761353.1 DNA repair protein RecO [Schwartzia sp. (in: firmicutes)]MBR1886337.1 DNA repair protein RecO [Schwartzia sp. (in: firmicutes)]